MSTSHIKTLPAPVAAISTSREVLLYDRQGRTHSLTMGTDEPVLWGTWAMGSPKTATFSWPTWSPDGRHLACFRLASDDLKTARVFVHEVGSVSSMELIDLDDRLPIYLHWSPDNKTVAVLSQERDHLCLSTTSLENLGAETSLTEGSPLFFTWTGDDRLAAFVGDATLGARLAQLSPNDAHLPDLPGSPGNFCAPLWVDKQVVYVLHEDGHTLVVSNPQTGAANRHIEEVTGLVALVASPDGKTMARAVAPEGDGTPYRRLGLIDVSTSEVREVVDMPCLAFLWSPTGERLIVARVDTDRNLLEWLAVDLQGNMTHLCDMYPTRDLGFYLRFFEQYTQSHALVDPQGKRLLLSGRRVPDGTEGDPQIWTVDLDTGEIEVLGEGLFAVFGPVNAPL